MAITRTRWEPSIEEEQSGNNEMLANTRLHVIEMEVETGVPQSLMEGERCPGSRGDRYTQ